MNSEELLLHHARTYLRLSGEFGPDAECVREQYSKLRDLLIVEIYFMSSVRSILSDEEMSGFVLYVEGSLRTMIDAFDPRRESLMPFLRHNMEKRALSYLASMRRARCFSSQFISSFITIDPVYPGPEDIIFGDPDELECGFRRTAESRLQYICRNNPYRQRHLFIFLCTLLPYVTAEIVDNFCRVLNIDRAQTIAIADYLCGLTGETRRRRTGMDYMRSRRNYIMMRTIELKSHLRYTICPEKIKSQLDYQSKRLESIRQSMIHNRMNIQHQMIAEILGVETSYVTVSVHRSKKILRLLLDEEGQEDVPQYIRNIMMLPESALRDAVPRRFEPFEQFNITMIPKPEQQIRFSARGKGIA
ncbi:MAG: hypothetical protein ILP16_04115 [Spirochaetales bacterium]|nr:hypothetical protein [Spirochaetales bacterium]